MTALTIKVRHSAIVDKPCDTFVLEWPTFCRLYSPFTVINYNELIKLNCCVC